MKAIRIALWALVAVAALGLAWITTQDLLDPEARERAVGRAADLGGPFTATLAAADAAPRSITQADLEGRPYAIFFGFTHCPDVCPTTLYEAGQWLEALGPDAGKVDVYFASVDPARDTAETMADYLRPFSDRIRAITGTPEEMEAMRRQWRVVAEKVPLEGGGYNVNHTATTFLMDADGKFFGTIGYGESAEAAVAKLKRLADS